MPSTAPYGPTYDFSTDPDPQQLVNAAALQTQFNLISGNLGDLIASIGVSIRDDNTLSDELVRIRNLHPELATYLDSKHAGTALTQALDYFYPVRAASTGNVVNLYDNQTIDGVALVSGDRVLLKNQTTASQNGLWIVHNTGDPSPHAAGLWTRADDLPAGTAPTGWAVMVREGTVNIATAWAMLAGDSLGGAAPTVGTNALSFFSVFSFGTLPIIRGGTGATTAAGARASLGAVGKAIISPITGDGVT